MPAAQEDHDGMLYDPEADAEDEEWTHKQRQGKAPSDAALSCPMCFTLVCIDCQQHPKVHNQYRAMFVQACTVVGPVPGGPPGEQRVKCADCGTVLGTYNAEEEMYYFLEVLASEIS